MCNLELKKTELFQAQVSQTYLPLTILWNACEKQISELQTSGILTPEG